MEKIEKPKFIKEIEKLEWKERAKCWKWFIRVYWKLDNKPMVELESLEIVIKKLHELEEENRKLKSENWVMKIQVIEAREDRDRLTEENKELRERIRFLEQCLDNKEKVNKSLREELEIWKLTAKDYAKQCWVDLDE